MAGKPLLLYVYLRPNTFTEADLKLLSERYEVLALPFGGGSKWELARAFRKQYAALRKHVPRAHAVFGWFADYHMVMPVSQARKRGKPVYVVLGGFDANHLPELGYGLYENPTRKRMAGYVLTHARKLLPVHRSLMHSHSSFASWPESRENGVLAHFPDLKTPYEELPTGYDPEVWPEGPVQRPPVVLSVAYLDSERTLRVKGIDLLVEAARALPELTFQVVGVEPRFAARFMELLDPPENLIPLPPVPNSGLAAFYTGASVYVQPSRTEGLPNVLCEAMLCGCKPVGSDVAGIPDAVGQTGVIVEEASGTAFAEAITAALLLPDTTRALARARISELYSLQRRRERLFQILEGTQ